VDDDGGGTSAENDALPLRHLNKKPALALGSTLRYRDTLYSQLEFRTWNEQISGSSVLVVELVGTKPTRVKYYGNIDALNSKLTMLRSWLEAPRLVECPKSEL
jgi:hypothetical protein